MELDVALTIEDGFYSSTQQTTADNTAGTFESIAQFFTGSEAFRNGF
jgi:hypothetical protein